MLKEYPVLNSKGLVRVVDVMGDDASIVQAARVSYGSGTKTVREDRGLIRYLMRHQHTTPFEMAEIKFHVKAPIFVARQWFRHRTGSFNEYSARYSELDLGTYTPPIGDIRLQSMANKQSSDEIMDYKHGKLALDIMKQSNRKGDQAYNTLLGLGVSRETARIVLPVSAYTEWYWKVDLWNLLRFLKLRTAQNAQTEIREYATTILNEVVREWVPHTYEAFIDYVIEAETLSRGEVQIIRKMIDKGVEVDYNEHGLNEREWKDFQKKFL